MKDDNELMQLVIEGDKKSFEELVIKYRAASIRFAKSYLKDEYLAEDIVQESFAKIYINRFKYKSIYSFKTYLFTIIRNGCIDKLRKKQIESINVGEEIVLLDFFESAEDSVIKEEDRNIAFEIFGKLNKEYRMCIYLYEYENMSYKEISVVMKKSIAQIKIIMYRARKKLEILSKKVR